MPWEPCISHFGRVAVPVTRSLCSLYMVTCRLSNSSTLVRAVTICTTPSATDTTHCQPLTTLLLCGATTATPSPFTHTHRPLVVCACACVYVRACVCARVYRHAGDTRPRHENTKKEGTKPRESSDVARTQGHTDNQAISANTHGAMACGGGVQGVQRQITFAHMAREPTGKKMGDPYLSMNWCPSPVQKPVTPSTYVTHKTPPLTPASLHSQRRACHASAMRQLLRAAALAHT